ncbi:MAG: 13E12 repeat family protein [Actinomycetota bacterium]|nr:13E12 repeat family protein [Actinomycetota bacterium]
MANAGKRVIERLDPDGDERETEKKLNREERAAHHNRFLSLTDDGAGGVRIKGRTTIEDAAVIKAALFTLAAPEPTAPGAYGGHTGTNNRTSCVCGDPECDSSATGTAGTCASGPGCAHDGRDPREHRARFLDALVEACRRLAGTDVLPTSHGPKPRLTLTMDWTCATRSGPASPTTTNTSPPQQSAASPATPTSSP